MHRFTTNETKHEGKSRQSYLPYLIPPALIIIFYLLIASVNSSTISRQMESLDKALNRDIIHCYSVEGYYPPSLEYIKEHYGLVYDESLFVIDYHPIASNLKPQYKILAKEK